MTNNDKQNCQLPNNAWNYQSWKRKLSFQKHSFHPSLPVGFFVRWTVLYVSGPFKPAKTRCDWKPWEYIWCFWKYWYPPNHPFLIGCSIINIINHPFSIGETHALSSKKALWPMPLPYTPVTLHGSFRWPRQCLGPGRFPVGPSNGRVNEPVWLAGVYRSPK